MRSYEGVFIFPPEAAPDARKDQFKNLDDLLAKFKAVVLQKTDLGRKVLGYPLRKFPDGQFLVVDFQMDPAHMTEFSKNLQLHEEILKSMITIKKTARANPKAAKSLPDVKPRTVVSPAAGRTAVS